MILAKTPLHRDLVDLLFLRISAMFGHSWSSRHTSNEAWEVTKDEWASGLAGIKIENIKKALDQLRSENIEFPPSLPSFISRCKSFEKKFFNQEIKENDKLLTIKEKSNIHEIMKKAKEYSISRNISHPEWDKSKYEPLSKTFCFDYSNHRKSYFVNLSDVDAMSLSHEDQYSRSRFLREKLVNEQYPHLFEKEK